MEVNHKTVDTVRTGSEVCIKVTATGGEAPRLFGRHFDHTDLLVSKVRLRSPGNLSTCMHACMPSSFSALQVSRESIDAVKNYFREDMLKSDWQLMIELKKLFHII